MNGELAPDTQAVVTQLERINLWLRILVTPTLRERLQAELQDERDRAIYQASTGASSREVARAVGVSPSTVVGAWERWAKSGVVLPTETRGRYQRLIDLTTLGIEV